MLAPIERQFGATGEPCRGEVDRLLALQNGFDESGGEEGKRDYAPDVTFGNAIAVGDGLK